MLKQHQCRLTTGTVPIKIIEHVINSGILIKFRRNCLRWTMISKNHPRTSFYYRSNTAINMEEMRHLFNYIYIIHPFSMFSLYWEFFMFVVNTIACILVVVSSLGPGGSLTPLIKVVTDVFLTLDLLKVFFTGFYDKELGRTILKPKSIASKYLKSYFLIDLLSVPHLCAVTWMLAADIRLSLSTKYLLRIIYCFKVFRIGRWLQALELFRSYADLSGNLLKTVFICGASLIWTYGLIFQLTKTADELFDTEYDTESSLQSLHSTTLLLLHVAYITTGAEYSHQMYQIVAAMIIMAVGYCIQMLMFTLILEAWLKFSNTKNKNESLFQEFSHYLKNKDLPMDLRKKFFSFYKFKFQHKFYNEAIIYKTISKILKQDILVNVTQNHVQKVEFFRDLPDTVLAKLVSRLKSEIFLANDIILTAGVTGKCMYLIYFGTVAIYSPGGKEICHLEDGAHFGEIALIFNEPRVATRLVDRFRSGLPGVTILAYLDDLIILSESLEKHLQDLDMVFQRLEMYKLRLNRAKCTFVCPVVKYLGHLITPHGIKPDPNKVRAILEREPPTDVKQVMSFIQTCSWFRRFIENFANVSRPLTSLLKKNAKWIWGTDQQISFDRLKELLTSTPILRQADVRLPYVLRTDSSSYALGAVWLKFSDAKNKSESLFQQFAQYLKHKDLPTTLKEKFLSFYQFKFQNQFYNEALINKTLSKILKQDILVYITKNHVQKVDFFKDLPDTVLARLVSRLKSEVFLANDIILTAGVAGNCMYFIYFGTVAIYSSGGKEICHLKDGAHFGEIALIFNEPRVATVRAVTPCELFTLNRSDFLDVLEPYPDIKTKITLLAQERLRTTTEKSMV
ncbi:hypothetical protein JTB14_034770 [Gonioctena quinquepunctata]|nr:hypothetical protein JTB14_034770 [Gonioctena quinquepunctata]